ncbi:uncharacterized protein LOC122808429 [Protopterus annectens]|uniref:uncharacterized protein LOC122808429 n=1 Tax=Protopterus annectens TaxID=7888 RepID=UPI001CFB70ED|nr:uncharacterized protein LOC122808429 [Protopterus annectens]
MYFLAYGFDWTMQVFLLASLFSHLSGFTCLTSPNQVTAETGQSIVLPVNIRHSSSVFIWYRNYENETNKIFEYDTNREVKRVAGQQYTGREDILPNISLKIRNVDINYTGHYIMVSNSSPRDCATIMVNIHERNLTKRVAEQVTLKEADQKKHLMETEVTNQKLVVDKENTSKTAQGKLEKLNTCLHKLDEELENIFENLEKVE